MGSQNGTQPGLKAFIPEHLSQPNLPRTAFLGLPALDTFPSPLILGQPRPQGARMGPWRAFVPGHLSQPNLPKTAFLGLPASDTFPSPLTLGQPRPQKARMGPWPSFRPRTPVPAQPA
jgi:hypothetical protein